MTIAYCEVCDWSRETGSETSRDDLNRAMIDHHVETGHAPIETDEPSAFAPRRAASDSDVETPLIERE
ncbi:hypothetical protein [Halovivax gelatinilyticus]|uniref:hypothetical protein n=1 Tax=Halovivax gelatinilyticus TaxID=2961597 RepID=UPI0020CA91F6|nr:hypothetical protein [Halovivax gelatinilyticus]